METTQIILFLTFLTLLYGFIAAIVMGKKRIKKLEQQISEYQQSDEDLYSRGKFSELGLMSAGIAHEISNPLSIILARLTQLMKTDRAIDKENLEKGLLQIKKNAERIETIIRGMRTYIYRNEESVEDFISLKEIIDNVLVFSGQRLKNHGIELRLKNIDQIFVSGHRGQYEQAILNLIMNSFDAVDNLPEKWIEISATKNEDIVQIWIKDSGHGISVDVREKMLKPFYSTKKGKGSGLGLTLVKGIAENHGGDLRYVEGLNTTFMMELPQASTRQYQQ